MTLLIFWKAQFGVFHLVKTHLLDYIEYIALWVIKLVWLVQVGHRTPVTHNAIYSFYNVTFVLP